MALISITLAGCTSSLLGASDEEILATTLTEVPFSYEVLQVKNINVFKDNTTGQLIEQEITSEEYASLALPNAQQPTYPNATWVSSSGGYPVFSSSTATLSDYQYMTVSTSTGLLGANTATDIVKIKLPGYKEAEIEKSYIKDNKIDKAGLDKVKSKSK